jgi:LPXTG-site transpeptidase (sortase) family protein
MAEKDLFDRIWEQKLTFVLVFFGIITLTYGILFAIDFIPEAPEVTEKTEELSPAPTVEIVRDEVKSLDPTPNRIIIDKLDREIVILNPDTSTIEALDAALLEGVVRHPDSADFGQEGTMFLLGHSSYLPNVFNKNFQAFNGIQKLTWGDRIRVQSSDTEYVYRVDRVYETKASEAEIEIVTGEPKLALATCDSFGAKDDRFVVEATLIEQFPL